MEDCVVSGDVEGVDVDEGCCPSSLSSSSLSEAKDEGTAADRRGSGLGVGVTCLMRGLNVTRFAALGDGGGEGRGDEEGEGEGEGEGE